MKREIETLVAEYDAGVISRRQFVLAVAAVATTTVIASAETFQGNSLNHVTLAVADPERSREFYGAVLGAKVVSRQSNGINVGLGDSFLGLYDIPEPAKIHHFCVGVDNYDIEDAAERLRRAGIEPYVRQDRPEIYFNDPDGIRVQLSEKEYRG